MVAFKDRSDAGRQLAESLLIYKAPRPVILALPRGGVIVAAEVATALAAPLDLVFVRKIGLPAQPELAMGAIADGGIPVVIRNDAVIRRGRVSPADFDAACVQARAEIERRRERYLGPRGHLEINGRVAIVIDDGVATGATTRAALRSARARKPARLVLAVHVGPADTIAAMREEADDVVCLQAPEVFDALGFFYADFSQTSDGEVIAALARLRGEV